jgi:hypothetical protein
MEKVKETRGVRAEETKARLVDVVGLPHALYRHVEALGAVPSLPELQLPSMLINTSITKRCNYQDDHQERPKP